NFVDNMAPLLAGRAIADGQSLGECSSCGAPTTGNVCAFCRLVETASAHAPVPVELVTKKGRGTR
ncbi:MAG TPA: tRNA(Ile)-lysidine synthetase, partial [Ilumatobacteraceae bacterium]